MIQRVIATDQNKFTALVTLQKVLLLINIVLTIVLFVKYGHSRTNIIIVSCLWVTFALAMVILYLYRRNSKKYKNSFITPENTKDVEPIFTEASEELTNIEIVKDSNKLSGGLTEIQTPPSSVSSNSSVSSTRSARRKSPPSKPNIPIKSPVMLSLPNKAKTSPKKSPQASSKNSPKPASTHKS